LELFSCWFANRLSLLHEVVGDLISTVVVFLIGFLVKNGLLLLLIINSFSHVLIFLKSDHLFDELFDQRDQIFISLFLLDLSSVSGPSCELVLENKQFFNILFSSTFQIFIYFWFHLLVVTVVIGLWEWVSADFLSEGDECSSWSNGTKKFKYVSRCHNFS
jgi:hypothetical protein